jgi:hypothetical protein
LALNHKSVVFFRFVCEIGGNATTCIEEWFPKSFLNREVNASWNYVQLGWIVEGNAVEKFFDEKLRDEKKRITLLENAARYGHIGAVKYFLKRCDVSSDLSDALRWASEKGHAEFVRLLLRDGRADPTAHTTRPFDLHQ